MTSSFKFSQRSLSELQGVHPDLVKITHRALELSPHDFVITDGKRTIEEQRKHVANGASQTMKSKHLEGLAVDFAPLIEGKVRWEMSYCKPIADAFKTAAKEFGLVIVWGGDWKTFKDGPHIELVPGKSQAKPEAAKEGWVSWLMKPIWAR